jgi:hypothetical protein
MHGSEAAWVTNWPGEVKETKGLHKDGINFFPEVTLKIFEGRYHGR